FREKAHLRNTMRPVCCLLEGDTMRYRREQILAAGPFLKHSVVVILNQLKSMSMKRSSIVVILMSVVLVGGSVLASGCKSDEFSGAPSVKAPVSDAPARPLSVDEELPPNHPPIGAGQASGSMGGM